jgi:alditol oxidase
MASPSSLQVKSFPLGKPVYLGCQTIPVNKRTFLKTSAVITSGMVLSEFMACQTPEKTMRTNWAGNFRYGTDNVYQPDSIQSLQDIIKSNKHLKALGSRHSFNAIADSDAAQVSMAGFNKVINLDKEGSTVTVGAGIKYGELCTFLHENGFAIHNLASLPHISVAGACATATHGSGLRNGSLASEVTAIEFVDGRGELVHLSKPGNPGVFEGAVVNLGALGITTAITLAVQPAFNMRQHVYLNMPMTALQDHFMEIMSAGHSVSLFTDWRNKNINQIWIKSKVVAGELGTTSTDFFGSKPATINMHPLADLSAENCTIQLGVEGPWYERMPHFRMGFTPSSGKELQSEYFIPIDDAYNGFTAIEKLSERIYPYLFISEIRTIDADEFWMSPFYKKPSVAFHFTWKQDWENVQPLLPQIEAALAPYDVRPHWGKLFSMEPAVLRSRIERLDDFKSLVAKHDPEGKFQNDFISSNLYA